MSSARITLSTERQPDQPEREEDNVRAEIPNQAVLRGGVRFVIPEKTGY